MDVQLAHALYSSRLRLLVVRPATFTAIAGWVVVAAWLLVRKMQGAFSFTWPESVLALGCATLLATLLRSLEHWSGCGRWTEFRRASLAPVTVAVLSTAAAVAPRDSTLGAVLLGAVFVAVEAGWWALCVPRWRIAVRTHLLGIRGRQEPRFDHHSHTNTSPGEPVTTAQGRRREVTDRPASRLEEASANWRPESDLLGAESAQEIIQQVTRWRTADGSESLRAVLRADFDEGERSKSLHLSFCPPLPAIPDVEVAELEGPPATSKLAEVQNYGVRIDVRLGAPSPGKHQVWLALTGRASGLANRPPLDESATA